MVECKARGAYLCAVTSYGNYAIEDTADFVTYVPKVDEWFMASLAVIPLQLLGYYVSVDRGLDVEKYLAEKELALTATVDGAAAYKDAEYGIIAAPTNYDSASHHFDTSAVEAVIELVMKTNPNAWMIQHWIDNLKTVLGIMDSDFVAAG